MTYKAYAAIALLIAGLAGCNSSNPPVTTTERQPEPAVTDAAREAQREAERAREILAKRLDQLDEQVAKVEARADKATGKAKANLEKQSAEMRLEARRLRDRMSTWDDKMESAWRTSKREVEEGLDKAENAVRKLVDDIKN